MEDLPSRLRASAAQARTLDRSALLFEAALAIERLQATAESFRFLAEDARAELYAVHRRVKADSIVRVGCSGVSGRRECHQSPCSTPPASSDTLPEYSATAAPAP